MPQQMHKAYAAKRFALASAPRPFMKGERCTHGRVGRLPMSRNLREIFCCRTDERRPKWRGYSKSKAYAIPA
jgi:hypothetical protein